MSNNYSPLSFGEGYSPQKPSNIFLVFRLLIPFVILFLSVWLIFSKFQKSPTEKIEKALQEQDFLKADKFVSRYLKKDQISRLRLLMYGSILQFGLQEQGKSTSQEIPDYKKILIEEDSALIFLKESYLRKLEMFPHSQRFLQESCEFVENFPSVYLSPKTQKLLDIGFESMDTWQPINSRCLTLIFDDAVPFFRERLRLVNATNVNFRKEPDIESSILATLSVGQKVLLRQQGPRLVVGSKEGNWRFIFLENQKQGWVFDGFLSSLP